MLPKNLENPPGSSIINGNESITEPASKFVDESITEPAVNWVKFGLIFTFNPPRVEPIGFI